MWLDKIKSIFKSKPIIQEAFTGGTHDHEWEEHYKEGWVFCWICGEEKDFAKEQEKYKKTNEV